MARLQFFHIFQRSTDLQTDLDHFTLRAKYHVFESYVLVTVEGLSVNHMFWFPFKSNNNN